MANAQVITQNNINDVVNSLVQNTEAAKIVVPKLLDTIKTIANAAKNIDANTSVIKKLQRTMTTYNGLMKTIVSSLCSDIPGGKTLSEIMGRIESTDEYDPTKKVVKWTTLEAAQQLPKLLDTSFKMLQTVGDFKGGFAAAIKIKRNVRLFKTTLRSVLRSFMDMFSDVVNHEDVDNILKKLIKQPDKVAEHIKHGYDYDAKGVKRVISDDIKKENEGGAPGILDVIDRTFSIIGLINNMKLPSFINFYAGMFKLRIQLKSVLRSIVGVFDDLNKEHGGKIFNKFNLIGRILVGDGEDADGNAKGEAIGMFQVAMKLKMIIDNLLKLNIDQKHAKKITDFFVNFGKIIGSMVHNIKSKSFIFLGLPDTLKRVQSVHNTVDKFISLTDTFKANFLSLLFVFASHKTINAAIKSLLDIIDTINKSFENAQIKNSDIFGEAQNAIDIITEILNNIYTNKKTYSNSKASTRLLYASVVELGLLMDCIQVNIVDKKSIDNTALDNVSESVIRLIEIVSKLSTDFKGIKKSVKDALTGMDVTAQFVSNLNAFIKNINSFKAKRLAINATVFEPVGNLVHTIKECAKDFAIMTLLVIPATVGIIATIAFAWLLVKFINVANKIYDNLTVIGSNNRVTKHIKTIVNDLFDIARNIVLTAIIVPVAIIGLIVVTTFTLGLILFVAILAKITNIVKAVKRDIVDSFTDIFIVISLIFAICAAFVLLAALAPLIIKVIVDNIIPLTMVLLGAIGLIFVFALLGKTLSAAARTNAMQFAINMILILGALMMTALVMLMVVKISEQLDATAFGKIATVILGMVAIAAVMVGLGLALTAAAPYIAITIGTLTSLAMIFVTLMVIGGMIVALGKLNFTFGEYDKSSENIAAGKIGSGSGAIGNVSKIMAFVKFIRMHLSKTTKDERQSARQSKRMLRQVKRVVRQILNIGDQLTKLQDITIDESKITENVTKIFAFVTGLERRIAVFLGAAKTDDNDNVLEIDHELLKGNARSRKKELRKSKKVFNKVDKIVIKLNDIGNALVSLEKFEMTDKFEQNIVRNITNIFTFINKIDTEINKFMKSETVNADEILDARKLRKKEWRKNKKVLSKVEATILTLQNVSDALNGIKELKLDGKTKSTIISNTRLALESVEEIGKIITGKSKSISIKERDIERLTPLVDYISNLNKGFEGIASSDPTSVKSNIDNYVKFIDKVNTVDVTKLQTSTKMFEQMSSFSSSIKGDFDKLAEALSEKLLPVLEELKEVMGVLPEKIDTGFQNTSASIAATVAPVTTTNVTEQVKRENPNMTPEQVKRVVDTRIAEKTKADATGIGAKLDELMALLRGFGSDNVIVKTL